MKIIGIISELNPLHIGHERIIRATKEKFGADFVIIIMSGDFVQRGIPSIVDKETKTKCALMAGADAVFELPLHYSIGSAEYFASGAISLLNSLRAVDAILFGSESCDISSMSKICDILIDEPFEYTENLREYQKEGYNFAKARNLALKNYIFNHDACNTDNHFDKNLFTDDFLDDMLNGSNNILGIEYIKAIKKLGSKLTPLTIKREGTAYNDLSMDEEIISASAIRNFLLSDDGNISFLQNKIPSYCLEEMKNIDKFMSIDDFSYLLKYKLISEIDDGFTKYADVTRELSDKIKNNIDKFTTITDFAMLLKSKEITYARIERSLLHILLNIKQEDYENIKMQNFPTYARLLGFKKESSDLLKLIKKESEVPIISTLSDSKKLLYNADLSLLKKDISASNIYHLVKGDNENEYSKKVIII